MLPAILPPLLICGVSLTFLVLSASRLVSSSAATARQFGINPIFVGVAVIALGTSMPELVVSIQAAAGGHSKLVIGNVLGSNIANALLGMAAGLLFARVQLTASAQLGWGMLAVTALAVWFLWDALLSRLESGALMLMLIPALLMFAYEHQRKVEVQENISKSLPAKGNLKTWHHLVILPLALGVLLISAEFLVDGARQIAEMMQVDEQIIGLTLLALGTSLPEIAAAIAAARQGETSLILANLLGSNFFNLVIVMGSAGLVLPLSSDAGSIHRDLSVLLAASLVLGLVAIRPPKILHGRLLGGLLVLSYLGYMALLVRDLS